MSDAELDRILSADEEIVPSSGFAASVMAAVQRDVVMNAPTRSAESISFPWKVAFPGLLACVVLIAAMFAGMMRLDIHSGTIAEMQTAAPTSLSPAISGVANGAMNFANLSTNLAIRLPNQMMHALQQATQMGLGWLLIALLLSYITVELSMGIAEWRR